MNVNRIDKIGVAQASLYLLGMTSILFARDAHINEQINNYKSNILVSDYLRYQNVEACVQNAPLQVKTKVWEEAYNEMQDSLSRAGRIQKNYLEGLQMVREPHN